MKTETTHTIAFIAQVALSFVIANTNTTAACVLLAGACVVDVLGDIYKKLR